MRAKRQARPRLYTDAEKAARWRAAHPEKDAASRAAQRIKKRQLVARLKAERGCRRCGIKDARVLDFHHLGSDKVMAVSQMISRSSTAAILAEVMKCELLCANCHRIEHAEARETG